MKITSPLNTNEINVEIMSEPKTISVHTGNFDAEIAKYIKILELFIWMSNPSAFIRLDIHLFDNNAAIKVMNTDGKEIDRWSYTARITFVSHCVFCFQIELEELDGIYWNSKLYVMNPDTLDVKEVGEEEDQ